MKFTSFLVAATLLASAAAAQAREVYWSIGIQAPLHPNVSIGTVFSNAPSYRVVQAAPVFYSAPVYEPAPVYAPPPVYYRPAPVYYEPRPVYRPAPVYYEPRPVYQPARVVYQPVFVPQGHAKGKWKHRHGKHHGGDRDHGDRDDD